PIDMTDMTARICKRPFTREPLSQPNHDCHVRPPERQLLAAEAQPAFERAVDAAKVSHIPTDADPMREKAGHTASKVHRLQASRSIEDAECIINAYGHNARAADEVRPERVFRQPPRQRDDDVARK